MAGPVRRFPTPLQGGSLTLLGTIIMLIAVRAAGRSIEPGGDELPIMWLTIIFVGAIVFSVGGMMLLVAIVRPFFEKRAVDERAERTDT